MLPPETLKSMFTLTLWIFKLTEAWKVVNKINTMATPSSSPLAPSSSVGLYTRYDAYCGSRLLYGLPSLDLDLSVEASWTWWKNIVIVVLHTVRISHVAVPSVYVRESCFYKWALEFRRQCPAPRTRTVYLPARVVLKTAVRGKSYHPGRASTSGQTRRQFYKPPPLTGLVSWCLLWTVQVKTNLPRHWLWRVANQRHPAYHLVLGDRVLAVTVLDHYQWLARPPATQGQRPSIG